jgi:hypothetical protein
MTRKTLFIFLLITGLSLFIRFWHFGELVNFHGDPPFYLHEVADMLDAGKIRLTGPIVMSKMIEGRGFFSGPLHYYVVALLGLATNWNVVLMTAFFTLLWIVFFIFTFVWLRNKFGNLIALTVYAVISFLPVFMPLSRTMWNPHFVPLFGILFLWALDKRGRNTIYYFLSGLFFGLGLNVHYSTVLWIPIVFWVVGQEMRKRKFLLKNWLLFSGGVFLAELPLVLFELRHNFYNLKTIIFQLKYGELSRGYTFALPYYFLYPGIPVFGFLLGYCLQKLMKTKIFTPLTVLLVLVILLFLKQDLGVYGQKGAYPRGWNLARQKQVVDLIIADNEPEFEVAETINSDTRAAEIRWWLRRKNIQVMGVADYDKARVLYLIAPKRRPPVSETVWEVSAMRPFKIEFQKDLGEGLYLYKLVKSETQEIGCNERYLTLVNPVRGRNLWTDKSLVPLTQQYGAIKERDFSATWLLQYDALKDGELVGEIEKFNSSQELGLFLEISEKLALEARVTYTPGFDWANPRVLFLSGYARAERRRLLDHLFEEFKAEFGYFPEVIGAWWIDSYSLDYLKQKYNIKSALIVADQQTTDRYGVWGQWWGVSYYPAKKNILVPATSKINKQDVVIIQWAQRHPDLAHGEGPAFSNYSLQANDYTSLGKDTRFFEELVDIYSDCVNPISQVTVGLETGIESASFLEEYQRQLAVLKGKDYLEVVTMSDYAHKFAEVYPDFPEKMQIKGETTWEMTPVFRKNEELGDLVNYNPKMAFVDFWDADESEFLNRSLPELKEGSINWPKQFETPLLGRFRASYLNNKYYLGIALDAFRFVGFSYEAPLKIHFVNQDFLNLKYFLRLI